VKIRAGGTAHIRVATPSAYFADRFRLELNDAPEGMTLVSATPAAYGMELVVAAADKMHPDVRGNLIFGVQPKELEKASSDKQKKPGTKSRLGVVATLPAVAFEVTE
jgi:hypothetical protein